MYKNSLIELEIRQEQPNYLFVMVESKGGKDFAYGLSDKTAAIFLEAAKENDWELIDSFFVHVDGSPESRTNELTISDHDFLGFFVESNFTLSLDEVEEAGDIKAVEDWGESIYYWDDEYDVHKWCDEKLLERQANRFAYDRYMIESAVI